MIVMWCDVMRCAEQPIPDKRKGLIIFIYHYHISKYQLLSISANQLLLHFQTRIPLQRFNVPTTWQPYDEIALHIPDRRGARHRWQRKDPPGSTKEPTKTIIGSLFRRGSHHQAGTPMEHDSDRRYQGPLSLCPKKDYGPILSFAQEIIGRVCRSHTWRQGVSDAFQHKSKCFPPWAKITAKRSWKEIHCCTSTILKTRKFEAHS